MTDKLLHVCPLKNGCMQLKFSVGGEGLRIEEDKESHRPEVFGDGTADIILSAEEANRLLVLLQLKTKR